MTARLYTYTFMKLENEPNIKQNKKFLLENCYECAVSASNAILVDEQKSPTTIAKASFGAQCFVIYDGKNDIDRQERYAFAPTRRTLN